MARPIALETQIFVIRASDKWASKPAIAELETIWEPTARGKITTWKQVRDTFPGKPLVLHGPGDASGAYDYFTAVARSASDIRAARNTDLTGFDAFRR
jgi:phosphate transport system substrate-binding protein